MKSYNQILVKRRHVAFFNNMKPRPPRMELDGNTPNGEHQLNYSASSPLQDSLSFRHSLKIPMATFALLGKFPQL